MTIKLFGKQIVLDKATVLKWTLIGSGGLLALAGDQIDRHLKDKKFDREMAKYMQEREQKWLKSKNDEAIRQKAAEMLVDIADAEKDA